MNSKHLCLEQISEGVYRSANKYTCINNADIEFLKQVCKSNTLKRVRINCHPDHTSIIQEMIICLSEKTEIYPHLHSKKDESFHIIDGKLAIAFLSPESPVIEDVVLLNSDEGPHYLRIPAKSIHLVVPISPFCIFHETTQGPFLKNKAQIPEWWYHSDNKFELMANLRTVIQNAIN